MMPTDVTPLKKTYYCLRGRPATPARKALRIASANLSHRKDLPRAKSIGLLLLVCAMGLHAQSADELAARGATLLAEGRYHEAELVWRQAEKRDPKDAAVHSALGIALAQQGELSEAAAEYRTSLKLRPHQPDTSYNLGIAEFKQGHFAEAIPALATVAKEKPEDGRSGLLLGMSYFGLREYEKATGYLHPASAADPNNVQLHSVLAQSCLWSKQYECALQQFTHILEVDPDAIEAHMFMAQALDAMDRTDDAIKELQAVAGTASQQPMLHFELGYLYYKKAAYEKASAEFRLEAQNNPGYAQAYAYLGDIAMRQNDFVAAEPLLKKAIEIDGELRLAHFDLGCVYAEQKKTQAALAAFQRAVTIDPAQPDAHYRLARTYAQLGEKEKAAEEFARTKELHARAEDLLVQKVSGAGAAAPR